MAISLRSSLKEEKQLAMGKVKGRLFEVEGTGRAVSEPGMHTVDPSIAGR